MGIFDSIFSSSKDEGDFLQVSESHNAEPKFSHREIVEAMIKAGHAIRLDDGKVIGIRKIFGGKGGKKK